jgi:hypothetical protein
VTARRWVWAPWSLYSAAGLVLCALYLFVPPFQGDAYVMNVFSLSSAAAILIGVRRHRPQASKAWYLMAVAQMLFFLGDVYTYRYPDRFPSLGDAFYLSLYPALVAGVVVLIRRRDPHRDRASMIDALIMTLGLGLLSWVFLIAPNLHAGGLSPLAKGVSVAYPLMDVLLLAAVLRLAVDNGRRQPSFYLLISSAVSLLVIDWLYGVALLNGTYDHQLAYDAGWIAYYLLWGAAALHPSMRTLEEPATDR